MTETYYLYLSASRMLLRRHTGSPWRRRLETLDAPAEKMAWDAANPASLQLDWLKHVDAAMPRAKPWLLGLGRPQLHVLVGSALGKFMLCDLPQGLRNSEEQQAVAQARMQQQWGINGADWVVALDRMRTVGQSGHPAIVCALRRTLLARVHDLAAQQGWRLVSLKPWVAGLWNAFAVSQRQQAGHSDECALAAIEDDAFTLMVARGAQLVSMTALAHHGEPELVEREISRAGFLFGPQVQQGLRLAVSSGRLDMVAGHAHRLWHQPGAASGRLQADFCDLLMATSGETA